MSVSASPLAPTVRSTAKHGSGGVHRTVSAVATYRRLEPLLDAVGITRIADITGLDRIGIPVYSCVRPAADRNSVSVTCGKGLSRAQARAGAIMEAVEYHCAEPARCPVRCESYESLSRNEPALDPQLLILPTWSPYRPERPLEWVSGRDLLTDEACWVPANAVFHPYLPEGDSLMILRGSTNGLASGNVLEEAICHALAELIERDAWSLCWVGVSHGRGDDYGGVDLSVADPVVRRVASRFAAAGVRLFLRDITSPLGVPAYYAATYEPIYGGYLAHEGMGAHPDARVALIRAMTEAAQSRAADIQGSREDIRYWRRRAGDGKMPEGQWNITAPSTLQQSIATAGVRNGDIRADVLWMLDRLANAGLTRAFYVDLTDPRLGIPVVRVIVPGLEFVAIDEYRVGARALSAARQAGAAPCAR
jgi:ribosomal protein S12 methylthiotransferase accessory factor